MPAEGCLRGDGFEARVSASGYRYPDTTDPDDAQWVLGSVDVTVTGAARFRAAANVSFWAEELQAFQRQLAALHANLSGEAVLTHLEGMVELRVRLDRGRGSIAGFVQDQGGARLQFDEIPTDQSYLFDAVAGLERIVDSFPPR